MAEIKSKDAFMTELENLNRYMTSLGAGVNELVLFDPGFVQRFTEFWDRWRAFYPIAKADADKFFSEWEKHADTLDLYRREYDVYKAATGRRISERDKAGRPPPPPGRTPGTAPRQPPRPPRAAPAVPAEIPRAPATSLAVPQVVSQNVGPILLGVGAGVLVLFMLAKPRRKSKRSY